MKFYKFIWNKIYEKNKINMKLKKQIHPSKFKVRMRKHIEG